MRQKTGIAGHVVVSSMPSELTTALKSQDWAMALRCCRRLLRKSPSDRFAHKYQGFLLNKLGQSKEAFQAYERARRFHPKDTEILINFANVLLEHMESERALPLLEKVCEMRPEEAVCWVKLAQCCYSMSRHQQGLAAAEAALAVAKTTEARLWALTQRAVHRRELGQTHEAVLDCTEAIGLEPRDFAPHTNRLLFMLSDPAASVTDLVAAAREFAAVFEEPLRLLWPAFAERDAQPWRRLRVGFLSPDFRNHSVMYFLEGLLAQLDRHQFEVFGLYLHPKSDGVTARVKRHVDRFVELAGYSPQQQAERIKELEIDILIDVAGHTGGNGLHAMMRKPAPIQLSWLGFPATTGLKAVDYKFSDEVTDPPGAEDQYSEHLYRAQTFFCVYRPMIRQPLYRYQPAYLVRPTPALEDGHITFGSCNNLGKLSDDVLRVWARILGEVPNSRLLIEGKNFHLPDVVQAYQARCESLGIDPERLNLVGLDAANQYLTYHRIDIALDPFPLTGGTTTFDTLWMGVPLVCMQGDAFKSRMSMSILTYLGRPEWVAVDVQDYVRIAVELAADVQRLNENRLAQRDAMEASVLMNEQAFTAAFSDALRLMWMEWAARHQGADTDDAVQAQLQQWVAEQPPVPPYSLGVGLQPGQRVELAEAHQRLQVLTDAAKSRRSPATSKAASITDSAWVKVTELAECILCAVPNDAVALAALAEVEHAHGHTDFAVTYLRHAMKTMNAVPVMENA